jgi:inositol-phosphate phosphatase/L-galactose 1-phosphate phosphatase/histidinol-phosphatase
LTQPTSAADAAGQVIRPYFRANAANEVKGVTNRPSPSPDKRAEEVMRRADPGCYSAFGVVGEVVWDRRVLAWTGNGFWICHRWHQGLYGWQANVRHPNRPGVSGQFVLGIIDQPINNERWLGIDGQPTSFNGQAVRTSDKTVLDQAILSTTGILLQT